MTLTTNARIAGVTYLVYLAAGMSELAVAGSPYAGVASTFSSFSALVLGVTLYAITREVDPDLALMAMACRVIEAVPGEGLIYFTVGNTLFALLLWRGRMVPVLLASLGTVVSAFGVVLILLQRAGLFGGVNNWSSPVTWCVWLPLLIFELTLAAWLLTKGVATPAHASTTWDRMPPGWTR